MGTPRKESAISTEGIDISDFQTVASFHDVASAGIGFVVCKATQGTYNTQQSFAIYRQRIHDVPGLVFGAYHFMDWSDDPVAQANHFLSVYTPSAGDLVPMLDIEAVSTDAQTATNMVNAFRKVVEPHLGGKRMLLYMDDGNVICGQQIFTDDFSGHPLWLADYAPQWSIAQTWETPTIWQYSGSGTVPGIEGEVDRDRFLGSDLASLVI